jgi:hypothetical protein
LSDIYDEPCSGIGRGQVSQQSDSAGIGLEANLIATVAVFLPSFLILIGVAPRFDRIRSSPLISRAIGGLHDLDKPLHRQFPPLRACFGILDGFDRRRDRDRDKPSAYWTDTGIS